MNSKEKAYIPSKYQKSYINTVSIYIKYILI